MTRANIELVQDCFPTRTHLERGSDGYPEELLPHLLTFFAGHICHLAIKNEQKIKHYQQIQGSDFSDLVVATYIKPGGVGNWSYTYKVDLEKGVLTVWDYARRWFYAPKNWEQRGWVCNETKNGRAGYTGQVKGKKIFEVTINELIENKGVKMPNGEYFNVDID